MDEYKDKPKFAWKTYARNIYFSQILDEWKTNADAVYDAFRRYYDNPVEEIDEAEGEKILFSMVACASAFERVRAKLKVDVWTYEECLNGQPKSQEGIKTLRHCVDFRTDKYLEKDRKGRHSK